MMTRRITLTIAAAILGLILIGVLVFAATGDGATTDAAGTGTATATEIATTSETEADPADTDGGGEATASEAMPALEEQAGIDGGQLYATHCASCHGDVGEGGSGGRVDDLSLTLGEVINITANGVPRMPAFADTLSVEEIEAVSDYTISLSES